MGDDGPHSFPLIFLSENDEGGLWKTCGKTSQVIFCQGFELLFCKHFIGTVTHGHTNLTFCDRGFSYNAIGFERMFWSNPLIKAEDFKITSLGEAAVDATAIPGLGRFAQGNFWVEDDERIPFQVTFRKGESQDRGCCFEVAGARKRIFFDPQHVVAGMVTCGGTCPGLNDVIRALFMELFHVFGVRDILGFRYGLRGLDPEKGLEPIVLTKDWVTDIHTQAGSILGLSRGYVDPAVIVKNLIQRRVNMLFVIGGDGTQRAAHAIHEEAVKAGYKLAVVGIPKTIDNDINFVYKTFGFDTAVSIARQALEAAHTEAKGYPNGVGLVKVMGRDSGFIAAYATLASVNVNFTLVPEIEFDLDGKGGLLDLLEQQITHRGHAVIVVAEGAGQNLLGPREATHDASGNLKHGDIGVYLKSEIKSYFDRKGREINLKYIDPSYTLRSQPSNAHDSIFAADLARHAVHAAMAGKTDVMIGRRFNHYIHVPIPLAVETRKKIDPKSKLWMAVLQATGQPYAIQGERTP